MRPYGRFARPLALSRIARYVRLRVTLGGFGRRESWEISVRISHPACGIGHLSRGTIALPASRQRPRRLSCCLCRSRVKPYAKTLAANVEIESLGENRIKCHSSAVYGISRTHGEVNLLLSKAPRNILVGAHGSSIVRTYHHQHHV